MKTLIIASALLAVSVTSRADWVSGHFRSNGTYVAPYYRTPANGIPYDNLSYKGYPSQQPGYISPRSYSFGYESTRPQVMPYYGGSTSSRDYVYRNPYAADPAVSV